MLRDEGFKPEHKDINIVLMNGGIGDHIGGSLIAVDYIIRTYPWINPLIWGPDFLLDFAKNVLPKGACVRTYSDMRKANTSYNPNRTTLSTAWDGRHSPMKTHQTDYAFSMLCDENPPLVNKNYLRVNLSKVDITNFILPEKYIVITTGYTAPVREFNPTAVNGVVDYAKSRGYEVVFLGQKETPSGTSYTIKGNFSEEVDFSKGINLIDKTTLLQVAKIISGAKCIVGVDCGILHVAACTDTPIVAGFTTVRPEHRAPVRHNQLGWEFYPVVPELSLKCRFCQSDTNYLYGHDYKFCIYKDYQCVKQLTADKFIAEINKILK